MPVPLPIDAVLLAGGEGRRLGRRKEEVVVAGRTLLERHLDRWRPLFARVSISARTPLAEPLPPEVATLLDPPDATSLIDVIEALIDRIGAPFWLVPVDLPLLTAEIPRTLHAAHAPGRSVFPEHARGLEMLCGLYDPSCRAAIAALRAAGERALHRIAEAAPCARLRHPDDFAPATGAAARLGPFFNVNTPDDLAALETALATGDAS